MKKGRAARGPKVPCTKCGKLLCGRWEATRHETTCRGVMTRRTTTTTTTTASTSGAATTPKTRTHAYKCKICKKQYQLKAALKDHFISIHTNRVPYKCQKCGKVLKWKNYANEHKRACGGDILSAPMPTTSDCDTDS